MNEQQQITDYVLGHITEADRAAFEQELDRNVVLKQEVESLRNVYTTLQASEKEADSRLDVGFYEMLAQVKTEKAIDSMTTKKITANHSKVLNLRMVFRYAATLAGFGFMFWLGRSYAPVQIKTVTIKDVVPTTSVTTTQNSSVKIDRVQNPTNVRIANVKVHQQIANLQQEIKATQELLILGLLQNTSTADRLKGLDIVGGLNKPNSLVMNELLKILKTDESLNVRLSAIETLEKFKSEPQIKQSFIAQLSETTEPFEQMSLIEALVQMRAKESLPVITKLEKDQTTDPSVRFLARNSISEITNDINTKE
jgi:hypothetical protein